MMRHDADVPTTSPLMGRRNFLVAATAGFEHLSQASRVASELQRRLNRESSYHYK
jgi:hypothetical protein